MGKLAEAIIAYKQSPVNSPKEREAKETIDRITGGDWWKTNVGTEFKWPKKHGDNKGNGKRIPFTPHISYWLRDRSGECEFLTSNKSELMNPRWEFMREVWCE
jgi:hypothetical protein